LGYRFVGPEQDPFALFNGWGCVAKAAGVGLPVAAFVLLIVGSQLAAADAASGALRSTLCAPLRRRDVFIAKAVSASLWAFAVFASVWAVALLFGALFFGFGDVVEVIRYGGETATLVHRSGADMAGILFPRVLPLTLPPLLASAFFGLACSFLAVRPTTALVSALLVYLPLEVFLKHFSERLAPYLFVTYTDRFTATLGGFASGLSTAELAAGDVRLSLLSSAVATALFLSGSFVYFGMRDVTE
jgi:ABC-type transport system involved in multi-copper enzyme maturation permease subunit